MQTENRSVCITQVSLLLYSKQEAPKLRQKTDRLPSLSLSFLERPRNHVSAFRRSDWRSVACQFLFRSFRATINIQSIWKSRATSRPQYWGGEEACDFIYINHSLHLRVHALRLWQKGDWKTRLREDIWDYQSFPGRFQIGKFQYQ